MPTTTTSLAAIAAFTSSMMSAWLVAIPSRIAGWMRLSSRMFRGIPASALLRRQRGIDVVGVGGGRDHVAVLVAKHERLVGVHGPDLDRLLGRGRGLGRLGVLRGGGVRRGLFRGGGFFAGPLCSGLVCPRVFFVSSFA